MVLGALALLVAKDRWGRGVTRAALLWELNLPETTVDDRLRTLMTQGRVERLGRSRYTLKPWPVKASHRSVQPEPLRYVSAGSAAEWSKNQGK